LIEPLVVLVPAYNAEPSLAKVVKDVRRNLPTAFIIGIDDGSTDGSRQLLKTVCDETIEFDKNRGKGAALPACPEHTLLNIKLPPLKADDIKGIRLTRLGRRV
jgi:cellulose synthase/poly-beta-1,6-N-acetylglucosamine synthase-like glycosyltransferase